MSLKLYKTEATDYLIGTSSADAYIISKNKRGNFAVVNNVYLSNTATDKWMSNITLYATSTGGLDVVSGTSGYGVKLYQGSLQPSDRLWDNIDYGNTVRINNIGTEGTADNSYYKIWVYSDVPNSAQLGIYPFNIVINNVEHSV